MLFRKSKAREERFRFPGTKHALDGHAAVYAVETMSCDAVLVRAVPELAEMTGPVRRLIPAGYEPVADQPVVVRHVGDARPLIAQLAGYAEAGLRAVGITASIESATDALASGSGKHLAYVINLTCRAPQRHSGAVRGSHDEYYRAADTGCFLMFATSAQETADLALIAHRIAELSLTPGICAQDYYRTTHSVQTVRLPDRGLVALYLGRPEDKVSAPTPAQRFLFGEERRRIPILVDRDRPAGLGGAQDEDSHYRGVAAQRPFFADHLDGVIDDAMSEFAKLTGRVYGKVTAYRVDDADVVVVAQGAVVEELEAAADYAREKDKIKAGVIALRVFRPFPGAELTRLLKGKTAVTVLERTDHPLAEDLPMAREIRSALSKATENGAFTGDDAPYPAYDRYARPADRPRVYSGAFGVGGRIPTFADLRAVFRNMTAAGARKKFFYTGAVFAAPDRRFPHLESLHQRLEKEYPGLDALSLAGTAEPGPGDESISAFQLYFLSVQGGLFAGNLFAQTLAAALDRTVRTYPDGGLEPSIQPVNFTLCHTKHDEPVTRKPLVMDAILVSGDRLLDNLPAKANMRKGGVLVVETNRSPDDLWRSLSKRTGGWITLAEPAMFTVDARKIAAETSSRPTFVDQLAVWALFGAYVETANLFAADELARFIDHLSGSLARLFDPADYLAEDVRKCFVRGMEETSPFDWKQLASETASGAPEPDAPWTVRQVKEHDRTVFDVNRFWHSVGYLYDRGEPEKTLTDPYLATGIVPAGSSAFRDMTPYRIRIPQWSPSMCGACGLCFSVCPDSALPSAASTIPSIIETALRKCEEEGPSFVHFPRIADHLSRQAYAIFSKPGGSQSETLGPVLDEAFRKIAEKLADGDKRRLLEEEFARVRAVLEDYPVAKTERFFDEPHRREKGSGRLFTVAYNPASCTGCGICVEVCPNDAHGWTEQTAPLLDRKRKIWEVRMGLPDPAAAEIDSFVSDGDPQTEVYRLLDKNAYHSMVGGDAAFPGNTVKSAVHLVTAAAETVMRPLYRAHVEKLDRLIARLEERIQGKVARTVEINDFEKFGERLSRLRREGVTAETLAKIVEEEGGGRPLDPEEIARLTGLLGKLKEQRASYAGSESGEGRARMALAIDPGTATFWSGAYPYNPLRQPWVSHLAGDAPALAEGIHEGIARRAVEEIRNCRQADLEASDSYDPRRHDEFFEKFGTSDLTDDEWDLVPPIIVIAHSGTANVDEIARVLSAGRPLRVVVIDTDGISVAEATADPAAPEYAAGVREADDLARIFLSRRDAFVLQTTIGHPGHLLRGVTRALRRRRPALFHIYAPDPQTSGIAPEKSAEHARLAYESRAFPLFTLDPERGETALDLEGNPDPGDDWTTREFAVREPSGNEEKRMTPLTVADWAFREARFQSHFRVVPKGQLNDQMKPLAEYLALDPARRAEVEPYIEVADKDNRHFLAVVSPAMARSALERAAFWTHLRRTAGLAAPAAASPAAASAAVSSPAGTVEEKPAAFEALSALDDTMRKRLTDTLLGLAEGGSDPGFFRQTLSQFIERSKTPADGGETKDD